MISAFEVSFWCLRWAIESMCSHGCTKVIFAMESHELVGAINDPKHSPSFKYQGNEALLALSGLPDWRVKIELSGQK